MFNRKGEGGIILPIFYAISSLFFSFKIVLPHVLLWFDDFWWTDATRSEVGKSIYKLTTNSKIFRTPPCLLWFGHRHLGSSQHSKLQLHAWITFMHESSDLFFSFTWHRTFQQDPRNLEAEKARSTLTWGQPLILWRPCLAIPKVKKRKG